MTRGLIPACRFWLCVVLLVVVSCGSMASCGDARPIRRDDAVATRTYVNARSELVQATASALPAIRRGGGVFVAHVVGECPAAMMAPHNAGFGVMSVEMTRAPAAVMRQANSAAIRKFDHKVASLGWSDPRLTLLVHDMAIREEAALDVATPDLCGDLKLWSRSSYKTVPASTSRYNRRTAALGTMEARSKEAAANWWRDHLPASERGICRHFTRGRHQSGYFTVCSGELSEPIAVARERRVIVESESIGDAIWKLLAPYENNSVQSMSHDVEGRETKLQGDLKQAYYLFVTHLSRSLDGEKILLPNELGLLGLPGAI